MSYHCEWRECKEVLKSMKEFICHVSFHSTDYVQETFAPDLVRNGGVCFSCGWRECGAQIIGTIVDFNRHVYFHVFHVRLKSMGTLLSQELNLGQCMLGAQSRNWIPELPEHLECSWLECGVIFDNPYLFYCHVSQHAEMYPEGKAVVCKCLWSGCDSIIRSKHKLKEHLRSHTQEKIIACPTCGGLFCSRTKLTDHIRRQAQSELLRYECSHCNRRFPTERMLREHMRRHVNHYKCPLCEMTCPSPSALRQHARYRHSEEKPFKCGHCEFSAKSSGDLRKHLDSHNTDDQFSCHISGCSFSARSYCSLALHFKRQHQGEEDAAPRYKCHVCEKTFVRGYPLTFHLKKKHMFQWPPGHSRFRYKLHPDGYFRLQTVRYESIDVTEPSVEDDNNENSGSALPVSSASKADSKPFSIAGTKVASEKSTPDPNEPLNLSVPTVIQEAQTEPLNLSVTSSAKSRNRKAPSRKTASKRARKEPVHKKKSQETRLAPPVVHVDIADDHYVPAEEDYNHATSQNVYQLRHHTQSFAEGSARKAGESGSYAQPAYVSETDIRQRYQGIAVGEYGEAEDANLHMLGDVALTATKDLTAITPLEAL